MDTRTPLTVGLFLLRGALSALGLVLQAVGALLEPNAPRAAGGEPKSAPGEVDEDGYIVKQGSTDLQ